MSKSTLNFVISKLPWEGRNHIGRLDDWFGKKMKVRLVQISRHIVNNICEDGDRHRENSRTEA